MAALDPMSSSEDETAVDSHSFIYSYPFPPLVKAQASVRGTNRLTFMKVM